MTKYGVAQAKVQIVKPQPQQQQQQQRKSIALDLLFIFLSYDICVHVLWHVTVCARCDHSLCFD